ncbi:MAG: 4Fe-4S binding protein [Chloroflexota bacterium]
MPQATIDWRKCDPNKCVNGMCFVKGNCPVKAIIQLDAEDQPVVDTSRCRGCSACVARCPLRAIVLE